MQCTEWIRVRSIVYHCLTQEDCKNIFSVNILEVILLTRVTRTTRAASASTDTVWGDFASYWFPGS